MGFLLHRFAHFVHALRLFKALRLFFFTNYPGPTVIPCPTSIPDSRVGNIYYELTVLIYILWMKVTMKSSGDEPQEMFNAPEDKLFNDGWVANVTEWQWEDMALPKVDSGSILKFFGEFDRIHGVVGLDNIRVYTKQK